MKFVVEHIGFAKQMQYSRPHFYVSLDKSQTTIFAYEKIICMLDLSQKVENRI